MTPELEKALREAVEAVTQADIAWDADDPIASELQSHAGKVAVRCIGEFRDELLSLVGERHEDSTIALYHAVGRYVKDKGGEVVVAGGVQIQEWGDGEFRFTVGVKCTGRKPKLPAPPQEENP